MVPFCDKLKHIKKSLKVKIFLNFFGTYKKVRQVADIYTTITSLTKKQRMLYQMTSLLTSKCKANINLMLTSYTNAKQNYQQKFLRRNFFLGKHGDFMCVILSTRTPSQPFCKDFYSSKSAFFSEYF